MSHSRLAANTFPIDREPSDEAAGAGKLQMLLLIGSGVVAAAQIGKAIISVPMIRSDLALGLDLAGLIVATFATLGAMTGIGAGLMVGRLGAGRSLIGGMGVITLGNVIGASATDQLVLVMARIIEGVGFLAVVLAIPSMLAQLVTREKRDFVMAAWSAYMPIGIMLMMLVAPLLPLIGWRSFWLANAVAAGSCAILLAIHAPAAPATARAEAARFFADAVTIIRQPSCLVLAFAFFAYSCQIFSLAFALPLLLTSVHGVSLGAAGLLSAMVLAVSAIGHLSSGLLLRVGVPIWANVAAAFGFFALSGFAVYGDVLPPQGISLVAALALGIGGLAPGAIYAAAPHAAPTPSAVPPTIGLVQQASSLGQFAGPAALGLWVEHLGWQAAPAILAPAALVGLACAFALRRIFATVERPEHNELSAVLRHEKKLMDHGRRGILIAGLAAMAGSGRTGRAATEVVSVAHPAPPPMDGTLRLDDGSRAAAAEDFGHIVHQTPEGVLLPGSDQDVATIVRWVGGSRRKIAPGGQSHSVYGRAQVRDGIVIDMRPLRAIDEVRNDRVVVGAGTKWSEVLAATLPRGLAPPVLTDYLELSVGGTLAVGGIGGATSQYGMQSDNVLELDVITGRGERITCSPHSNTDLFHTVRAGLGQVGIITRATLKLIPAPEKARRYVLTYPDLTTLLTDERLLAAENRFDAVQGSILPTPTGWTFRLDAVCHFSGDRPPDDNALLVGLSDDRSAAQLGTLPYFDYLNRLAALEQLLRSNGQWFYPHPWLMTFVGDSNIEAVVSRELDRLTRADLGTYGQVTLSAFRRSAATSPLLRLPADNLFYAFNLVRIPTTDAAAEVDRLITANRAIYERVRAAGGTLYPVSAFPMSRDDWRRHFGPAWARLRDAKQSFDPAHVLTPGYEIF